jgi:tetratricopeptide (TPR) repeat protein
MAKKKEHKNELLEHPAERLGSAENWMERNSKTVIALVAIVLLAVAGYFGFNYYKKSQDAQAQPQMFQAVYYFEADSLDLALDGDGNNLGFLNIIEDYKFSSAANLAHFYAGVCYLKKGEFDAAILYLEDFSSDDLLVQARAYSLIGDAHMEKSEYEDAARFYDKAANYEPNKQYSPAYLMKAALAYEKLNQNDKAKDAYSKIISDFWDSQEYQNAVKFKARLETNS